MKSYKIILIDDHHFLGVSLRDFLLYSFPTSEIVWVRTASQLKTAFNEPPDLVLVSASVDQFDEYTGLALGERMMSLFPHLKLVLITDRHRVLTEIQAKKIGAIACISLEDSRKEIMNTLSRAMVNQCPRDLNGSGKKREHESIPELTDRECEVFGLMGEGNSVSEIANNLFISTRTVENHIYSIYHKLGVHDRVSAIIKGYQLGFFIV